MLKKKMVNQMAIITKVSAQKRPGRYNIFLDGHYAFSVSEKTLAEFVLLKGQELTDQQIDQVRSFDADAKATELAARYLGYEPRTIKEVHDYLVKHEISEAAAASAIGELADLGYLNDPEYARLFIKNDLKVGQSGPKAVSRDLQRKGLDQETAADAIAEVAAADWIAVGQRLVKSLIRQQGKIAQKEVKRKMQAKLFSHGFTSTLAAAVVDSFDFNDSEEEQLEALKRQGIKAYKRFRRYDEGIREQKIKQYLYVHGFSTSEIAAFLSGEVIDLDELSEY